MVRVDITLICVWIPLILGAPADDSVKQQLTSGMFRNDDGYWSMVNPDSEGDNRYNDIFEVKTRALDSLGQGHILRSLGGLEGAGEWGNQKSPSWRIDAQPGYSSKRGGGLDSLGRGNILRRINSNNYDDEMYNFARSISSLGKGLRGTGAGAAFRPLRRLDAPAYGLQKKFDSLSGSTFGTQKRNFDEIDRAGFGTFVKKNFDEIDRVGLGFNKRNFDEIDRTGFGSFV